MESLKNNLWNANFSHIYIEKDVLKHPNTKKILNYFKDSVVVLIDHYKEVFCRSQQNFTIQKESQNLILASKKNNLVYEGADVCDDFGNSYFYYTSSIMNCIYDCEYCYLRGMYPSSNIVVFVNIEDIFKEVENLLNEHPVYLCVSYDSDLLAFEKIVHFSSKWMEFAKKHSNLKIELRTKSANFGAIDNIECLENVILAWTLSPDKVIKDYEKKTPSLDLRIENILKAIKKGWKVRICFDPLLYIKNWDKYYGQCVDKVFNKVPSHKVYDVSIGVFRVSKEYLKKMRREKENSNILTYPFQCENGVYSYSKDRTNEMIGFVYNKVLEYIPKDKIYI